MSFVRTGLCVELANPLPYLAFEPSKELVAKILERAAVQGPVALVEVAEGLFGTQSGAKMTLDIPTYAGMLQRLVLDPACYRPAAVRLLLNVALSKAQG